jgi:hypothetical protein
MIGQLFAIFTCRRKALEEQEEDVRELEEGLAREKSRKLELQV